MGCSENSHENLLELLRAFADLTGIQKSCRMLSANMQLYDFDMLRGITYLNTIRLQAYIRHTNHMQIA